MNPAEARLGARGRTLRPLPGIPTGTTGLIDEVFVSGSLYQVVRVAWELEGGRAILRDTFTLTQLDALELVPGPTCGVCEPVCPHCLGQLLKTIAGQAACPGCGRRWHSLEVSPCPWPADETLSDLLVPYERVCSSHARHIRATAHARTRP